ncbi:DsbA family protein [Candidatus Wolfebacteria bacterium]|nr:DsbA family protein [Candidatus Wolfebacteria bacterium]
MNSLQAGYGIPIAIVVAGVLIAGVVFWTGNDRKVFPNTTSNRTASESGGVLRIPSETDHIRGNPDASIVIVEFSDLECPFCAQIHPTLDRIVKENNDVKWIFRHFPLSTIHSRALSAAVASECIAKLSGNEAFWSFTDAAFLNQRQLGDAWYREQAASFGIDLSAFEGCMNDKKIVSDIQADFDEATGVGGRGTPYVVVVTPSGDLMPFSGALPYAQVSAVIEQARNN